MLRIDDSRTARAVRPPHRAPGFPSPAADRYSRRVTIAPPFPTLSHYRLIEPLGAGGMGEVWLAEDLELPRRVAIKLLARHLTDEPEAVERLLREARAAASIDHPNVVTVFEAGTFEGRPYLVMQRVDGETLERRLSRGSMPVAEALALARAVADALAEVHALGIVHRDLKPSNIMLTTRGPKILDFGIAAARGFGNLTQAGNVIGTPSFMSPEQIEGLPTDNRSDLWSLGVVLYQALTGVPPFRGDTLAALAQAIVRERPEAPSRRNSSVPAAVDIVVSKLLRKEREHRYARAEDLIADLETCLQPTGDPAETLAMTAALPAERPVPRLAVLYFDVLSANDDDAVLADGLTEDLIVDLARVEGLRVAARGEVGPFRGRDLPPRTLARELNVDYVLQGSVRRAGQRARISAQLVRASDGHASWAERFDRSLDDLFDVQAEVSRRIVEALQVSLRPAERELLDRAPTSNREAYALYLRGRALMDENRRDGNLRAEQCLRDAVRLDPSFALAHAALGECLTLRCTAWWGGRDLLEKARPAVMRALELDPDLPQAHVALGQIYRLEGNAEGVIREIGKVAVPGTSDAQLLLWAGWSYMTQGRPNEAVEILERAHRLHPRHYRIASSLTDCYLMLGRHEDERRSLERMIEMLTERLDREPDDVEARVILAISLAQAGQKAAGIAQAERAISAAPEDGRVRYNAACTFAHAGEPERALEQLRIMVELAPEHLTDWIRRDPDFAGLRDHPEFVRLFGKS